jgi:hypothetical protein
MIYPPPLKPLRRPSPPSPPLLRATFRLHLTTYSHGFGAVRGTVGTKRSSSHTANFSKDAHLNQYPSNNNWSDQGREFFQAPPLSISAHISTDVNYVPVDGDDLFSCVDNSQDHSVGYVTSAHIRQFPDFLNQIYASRFRVLGS